MEYWRATIPMTLIDSTPFPGLALADGGLLVYDRETPNAWIQSSDPVPLSGWR